MKWLSKIKELASLITAVTVVIGVLWGAFRFMDKSSSQGDLLEEIKEQQSVVIDSLASLSLQVQDLTTDVSAINDNVVLVGNYVEAVHKGMKEDLRTRKNAELEHYVRIETIIEEGLKKNDRMTALPSAGNIK